MSSDLPADVTTEELAARLTALGLKLEAIERPGHDITGPLVVGRVLSFDDEPQKNGKTIRWCSVDVGDANGTGEPQGIVCGAHNFAVGDLVPVILPGGVLPGDFEISARKTYGHVSCRDDLLGRGAWPRRRLIGGRHHRAACRRRPARRRRLRRAATARRGHRVRDQPRPRLCPLAARCRPRGRPRLRRRPSATPPTGPSLSSDEAAYPVVVEDPVGCPVFAGRSVTGFDPSAPTPDWMARRIQLAGMRPISLAVDVTNYVMLELGQPIHGYDRDKLAGPIVVRRARPGERLTTLDGADRELSDRGPADHRRLRTDRPRRCDGRRDHRAVRDHVPTSSSRPRTGTPVTIFRTERRHKLPSEAAKRFERGTDPTIALVAADRVAELLTTLRRRHGRARRDVCRRAPAASRSTDRRRSAGARHRHGHHPPRPRCANLRAVGCEVDGGRDRLTVTPPPWRADLTDPFDLVEEVARIVGYANVPSVLPPAAPGRGLTRSQRLRRRIGRTLAGEGFVEVVSFPFVGTRDLDALGLARRRPAPLRAPSGQPAVVGGAGDDHHAAARACSRPSPATPVAATPTWRCSRPRP